VQLKNAGVTYLFVDHINGTQVTLPPDRFLLYSNEDFAVFKVP
jgi:hypothetical protein